LPLIFLVAVVAGWLQIVAADADARRGFFNGLLILENQWRVAEAQSVLSGR
jgi:hypothetical protein